MIHCNPHPTDAASFRRHLTKTFFIQKIPRQIRRGEAPNPKEQLVSATTVLGQRDSRVNLC
jgi:hypothetical protein